MAESKEEDDPRPVESDTSLDTVASRIAPIFGFTKGDCLEFMNDLSTGNPAGFEWHRRLPVFVTFEDPDYRFSFRIQGGYGVILNDRTDTSIIYKCMLIDKGNTFDGMMEAFIQATLCTDPEVGKYICRLDKVYYGEIPKVSRVSKEGPAIILKMERLTSTIDKTVVFTTKANSPHLDVTRVQEMRIRSKTIVAEVIKIIRQLQRKYDFFHADLHYGNILIKGEDQVKLIDFGLSSIVVGEKPFVSYEYSSKEYKDLRPKSKSFNLSYLFDSLAGRLVDHPLRILFRMIQEGKSDASVLERLGTFGGRRRKTQCKTQQSRQKTRRSTKLFSLNAYKKNGGTRRRRRHH